MEEKKKKKFIIPLPYTGGNLGKTLMFGLVIVLAVVGAMMLQAKELTRSGRRLRRGRRVK